MPSVTTYALRRLLIAIPTLLVISLVVFSVLALAPGDPLSQFAASTDIPPEVRENIRKQFGLDQPIYVRYFKWLGAFVQGDWGFSFGSRIPASTLISLRIPTTLWVIGMAYLIAMLIAIPLGVLTAARQYSWFDHIFTGLSFIGFSLPTFFTGVLLIILFSVKLRWLPMVYDQQVTDPIEWLKQAIMPITVLALFQAATLNRYVRASMLDNLNQDYARTARAKGLRRARRRDPPRAAQRAGPGRDADRAAAADGLHRRGRDRADLPRAGHRRAADLVDPEQRHAGDHGDRHGLLDAGRLLHAGRGLAVRRARSARRYR